MTQEKIMQVCGQYRQAIDNSGFGTIIPKEFPEPYQAIPRYDLHIRTVLQHLRFMCEVIPEMHADVGKQGHWLGWLQGVVYSLGLETLQSQRERNR